MSVHSPSYYDMGFKLCLNGNFHYFLYQSGFELGVERHGECGLSHWSIMEGLPCQILSGSHSSLMKIA